jgi:hypothetical protein
MSTTIRLRPSGQVRARTDYVVLDTSKSPYVIVRQDQGYQDVPQGGTNHPNQSAKTTDIASTIADPTVALENALKWLKKEKKLCVNRKLRFRYVSDAAVLNYSRDETFRPNAGRATTPVLIFLAQTTRPGTAPRTFPASLWVSGFVLANPELWASSSSSFWHRSLGRGVSSLRGTPRQGKRNYYHYVFTHRNAQIRRTNCRNKTRSFSGLR